MRIIPIRRSGCVCGDANRTDVQLYNTRTRAQGFESAFPRVPGEVCVRADQRPSNGYGETCVRVFVYTNIRIIRVCVCAQTVDGFPRGMPGEGYADAVYLYGDFARKNVAEKRAFVRTRAYRLCKSDARRVVRSLLRLQIIVLQ